jgi:hypothetical protein
LVADFQVGQDLILSKLIFWGWVKNVAGRSGHWFSPRLDSCGDSTLLLGLRTGRTCHQQKCKFCQQKDDRWRVWYVLYIYIYIQREREKICYVYMLYAICGSLIIYTQHEKNVLFSLSCLLTLGYSRSGPFPSRQGSCSAGQPVWARRLCARRSRRPSLELRTADGNGTFFKQN